MYFSAEKVFSDKYAEGNGNCRSIAAFNSVVYSVATDNQRISICNIRSAKRSSRASCSSDDR